MSPAAGGERRRPPLASARSGRSGWGWGRVGPAGTALLGLSLLGLALYLVPAAAALAWLAVGATAAWWGWSREPRGPRTAAGPGRHARRPRTLAASPPLKPSVNGDVLEPRTLLEGPDPAELLLLGGYLGKPGPPRDGPARSPLAPAPARRAAPSYPVLSSPVLPPSRRPAHRDSGLLANRFIITPRRRYPIQQPQYSLLGALPTVCWNGCPKKTVLSARNSKMVCSPVTVRIAPPDSKPSRPPPPGWTFNPTVSSPSVSAPDPCAKETVLNALKERRKRTVEEEDPIALDGLENKRRRHDSSGSGHSAFEPLVANGVPAAFVPKPGSLKRGLNVQNADDHSSKRSRTSSVSSLASTCAGGVPSSSRNAISSSYSSTRGFPQPWKKSGPTASPFSSPASSRSQTPERPAKKTREEEPPQHSSSSPPLVTDKESQGEGASDATPWKKQNSESSPLAHGSTGQRKRRIQLLPSRRGEQLTLPPPPQLGYSVTAEDFDMEKKASLQWFNKALEDKTDTTSDTAAENPPTTQAPLTFSLPAVSTSASPASLTTGPSTNPLLESLKKMQGTPGPPAATEPAAAATALTPSPPKVPSLLAPATCAQPEPLADTSSDSKPAAPLLMLSPASATTPVADATKSPSVAPQAEPPAKAPSPTPSTLLGMLGSSPAQPASPEAPARDAPSSMFKPIFSAAPKSESESPVVTATAPASTAAPTATSSASSPTLKPIFSSMGLSAPTPLASPFFKQTTTAATTPASTAPLFSGLAAATSTVASATVVSSSADSAKPVFGFGLSAVTSAPSSMASSTTTASTTTAQPFPFLFGAPPASGASLTPSGGSTFQFGKPAVPTSTAVTTTFGQSLASTAPTATSSTAGFSGFGSLTTSASAAPSQPTLTFSTTSQAFNIPFGSAAKPSLPSFPGTNPQPAFGATDGQQQQGAAKPTLAPSFGSSFSFGTPTPAPTPSTAPGLAPAQPAFGSTVQSSFGGLKNTATAFGTPASTQPAFGSSSTVFSFGASTTTGFGVSTPTTSSGTSSTVFGSTTPSLFTFGSPSAPAAGSGFGLSVGTPGASSTSGGFSFGAGQSGTTGTATPFGGALSQNSLGTPNQTTPFAFNMASTPESKPVFGGTSTPTFGQNASTPGAVTAGSSLSFGVSSTPTQGFVGMGPFGSAAPSFSIGAGSKTPGARQRLQARRQHTRKK
ncbi:nuclear envelope pore membrane protein POM 121C-like isoform X1 [Ochotona curzoniae]|uniref:nuclear envelope pore membrane protein POM 121C-like isoform X1 n=1 Tax=Ochotona curzoniae TaxID=130825 RepID=UPI001B34B3B8|nr:nuclear envelope pore membrane protein POM 121C-like isoform X1 [Ochotona curzoniae]